MKNKSDTHTPSRRLLRKKAVLEKVPFCNTTLWKKVKEGEFPKPVQLGPRMIAFYADEVDDYIESFKKQRNPA